MENTTKRRVTLHDIAAATGLHYTTVSLALRNSPKLRPETLRKVHQTAEDLGYAPDPMLSALNAYRQSKREASYQATLAWINNWPHRAGLLEIDTFRQYYEGACDRAHQLGYSIEEFWLNDEGMNAERLVKILKARNIQGLLLAPQPNPMMAAPIDVEDFCAVVFGYSIQPSVLNVVTSHHFHTMNLIITNLTKMGYRRIGLYIPQDWDERVENAWLGGLKLAYLKHPELIEIPPVCKPPSKEFFYVDFQKWLRKYKPDVVVASQTMEKEVRKMGYRVPEDIGFASLSLTPPFERLSGADENSFHIGQKAVDVLIGLLHRGERGVPKIPVRLLVESTWIPGRTLRPQAAPAAAEALAKV